MPHTPGPWTVDMSSGEYSHGLYRIEQFDAARTYQRAGVDSIDAEDEANARLIAAAPDLLAALKRALDAGIGGDGERPSPSEAARLAIAQACGEAVQS